MSFFRKLWDQVEHDAKPLLSAAAQFAEDEGMQIVRQVALDMEAAGPEGLVVLFNKWVAPLLGVDALPPTTKVLSDVAIDLLATVIARARAQESEGTRLRVSVLNAGVEQAVLLVKGAAGDKTVAPTWPPPATH